MELERLYSLEEAADYLRLSPETLRKWARVGRIGFSKIGDRTIFSESDILSVINRRERPEPRSLSEAVANAIREIEAANECATEVHA